MRSLFFSFSLLFALPAVYVTAQPMKAGKYVTDLYKYVPQDVKQLHIDLYFDYVEAMQAGKVAHKPVIVYFTGINCVNCRKMESVVWKDERVAARLRNDFIVAFLLCDATMLPLPVNEQYYSKVIKRKVENLAHRYWVLQDSVYKTNFQPAYYFADGKNGKKLLTGPMGYEPGIEAFIKTLDNAAAIYKKQ